MAGSAIGHRMLGMITRAPSRIMTMIMIMIMMTMMVIMMVMTMIMMMVVITKAPRKIIITPHPQDCSPTPPSCSPRAKCTRSGQRSLPQTAKKYKFKNQYKYKL